MIYYLPFFCLLFLGAVLTKTQDFSRTPYAAEASKQIKNIFYSPKAYVQKIEFINGGDPLIYKFSTYPNFVIHTNSGTQSFFEPNLLSSTLDGNIITNLNEPDFGPGRGADPNLGYYPLITFGTRSAPAIPMNSLLIESPIALSPIQANYDAPTLFITKDKDTGGISIESRKTDPCLDSWVKVYEGFIRSYLEQLTGLTHLFYYCLDLKIDVSTNEIGIKNISFFGWTKDISKNFKGTCSLRSTRFKEGALCESFALQLTKVDLSASALNSKFQQITQTQGLAIANIIELISTPLNPDRQKACDSESAQ